MQDEGPHDEDEQAKYEKTRSAILSQAAQIQDGAEVNKVQNPAIKQNKTLAIFSGAVLPAADKIQAKRPKMPARSAATPKTAEQFSIFTPDSREGGK